MEIRVEEGKAIVDNVEFGNFAEKQEKQKINLDWAVRKVLVPADRFPKVLFYTRALLLLAGVILLQQRRQAA